MSKDLGREIGQHLRQLSHKVSDLEAKNADLSAILGEVKAQNSALAKIDYGTILRTQELFDQSTGAEMVKMVGELSDQINSASEQAALEQHDTRSTITEAAKMIADALDRHTAALQMERDDGKEKPSA